MTVKEQTPAPHIEPRWPVALAILIVLWLLAILPARVRFFPVWVPFASGVAVLLPMAGVGITAAKARWLRVERAITLLFVVFSGAGNLVALAFLVRAMIFRSAEVSGLQLLTSSIAVWVMNVLAFSLLYWQIDRGGPGTRAGRENARPDWLFPQEGAPAEDVPAGWRPVYVDYLFLGYSTATAFSTTDVMPLTSRAKLMMMFESTISLVTLVVVAARAINILGS
jgi:uncharacterized membrane protein